MKKSKRVYSESFKEKAVSLSHQRENIKELANELGIQVQRIYKWRASGRKQVNLKSISNSK
jgi:transposase